MGKIAYILGTGYCGSTALEMCLGAHEQVICLGEINRVLNQSSRESLDGIYSGETYGGSNGICSCSQTLYECNHWGEFYKILVQNIEKSFVEKYILHYEFCQQNYSKDVVLIDSSKSLKSIQQLSGVASDYDIVPLILSKDVRNWTTSVQKKHGGSAVKRYVRWFIEHKKLKNFASSSNQRMLIGYEEFALFPELILKMICERLGLEYSNAMLTPDGKGSHSVLSNRMRYDEKKKSQVFYDYRWFKNRGTAFASLMLPFIMNLNDQLVYSNNILEDNFNYKKEK